MRRMVVALVATATLLLAPSATASPVATAVSLDQVPEGLAIDNLGNIYVGGFFTGEILKLAPGQMTPQTLATLPINGIVLLGLAVDQGGNVYACVVSFDENHGVWRVRPDGSSELYGSVPAIGAPNALAFDRRGHLYVSDSSAGVIWRVPRGGGPAELWLDDPLLKGNPNAEPFPVGANGLAFDERGDLFVASSDQGVIVRVAVRPDGTPAQARVFYAETGGDGLAFDVRGNLYAGAADGSLVRIHPDGVTVETLATPADGFESAVNFAFGTGRGERKTLYFTDFGDFATGFVRSVDVGLPGRPLP